MAILDDMAKLIGNGMKAAGMTRAATLTVITPGTRTPGALSAGTNPTEADAAARGIVVRWRRLMLNATTVQATDRVVLLFGSTIAGGATPKVGDKITIEGVTSRIVDIERDPAAATYTCLTRR